MPTAPGTTEASAVAGLLPNAAGARPATGKSAITIAQTEKITAVTRRFGEVDRVAEDTANAPGARQPPGALGRSVTVAFRRPRASADGTGPSRAPRETSR